MRESDEPTISKAVESDAYWETTDEFVDFFANGGVIEILPNAEVLCGVIVVTTPQLASDDYTVTLSSFSDIRAGEHVTASDLRYYLKRHAKITIHPATTLVA